MTTYSQRQVFLQGEGDAWFERNRQSDADQVAHWADQDPLAEMLENLPLPRGPEVSVLEVGCGQGLRLARLAQAKGWAVIGLDPSEKAIAEVNATGCTGLVGTAEALPLANRSVDLLIYGFCLYLCDRDDLFRIAAEAHRVLKPQAWIAILDFWSPHQSINPYHHYLGVHSFKDNLPAMFTWHPSYVITDHRLRHHVTRTYTDEPQEWVATTLIRHCNSISGKA
jgi:ubiquinone/menaquinone biosynthesis C-methylase UbiE